MVGGKESAWGSALKFLTGLIPQGLQTYLQDALGNDSLKRLVSWMAATTLGLLGYGLLLMMGWQVGQAKPIDPVLRDCFVAVVGFIATLAMVAYRKPEPAPTTAPPPGGSPDVPLP